MAGTPSSPTRAWRNPGRPSDTANRSGNNIFHHGGGLPPPAKTGVWRYARACMLRRTTVFTPLSFFGINPFEEFGRSSLRRLAAGIAVRDVTGRVSRRSFALFLLLSARDEGRCA